jgi:hypothetical protein
MVALASLWVLASSLGWMGLASSWLGISGLVTRFQHNKK